MNDNKMSDPDFLVAVARGDTVAIVAALEAGTSANARDQHENSALMIGCARGRTEICRLLIGAGAATAHRNKWGLGPSDWLRWATDADGIRKLLAS